MALCDAKLGIQLKMRNIASFGATFFELRMKVYRVNLFFQKVPGPLLSQLEIQPF